MAELAECFVIQLAVEGSILLSGGLGLRLDRVETLQSCKNVRLILHVHSAIRCLTSASSVLQSLHCALPLGDVTNCFLKQNRGNYEIWKDILSNGPYLRPEDLSIGLESHEDS